MTAVVASQLSVPSASGSGVGTGVGRRGDALDLRRGRSSPPSAQRPRSCCPRRRHRRCGGRAARLTARDGGLGRSPSFRSPGTVRAASRWARSSSSARWMASRPPLSSSWIWVRQENPSASTTASGSADRSAGSKHLLGAGLADVQMPASRSRSCRPVRSSPSRAGSVSAPARWSSSVGRRPSRRGPHGDGSAPAPSRARPAATAASNRRVCLVSSSASVTVWLRSRRRPGRRASGRPRRNGTPRCSSVPDRRTSPPART